ncbi:GntR family transcriptional regulator [Streptomyces sp. NPDC002870]|uniref:GntR family transcriptional regulator n=1 Tax=Streptomyces sp. NPDC002870 TaxID=3364666 RepID=UPI00369D6A8A
MTEEERNQPAWRLIADALRSDVADEVYPPGSPLPGESQLAERYDVSRPTVRRAINVLVGEGLLHVAHGRGTFVRARPERRVILINGEEVADLLAEDYDPSVQGWLRGEHAQAVALRRSGVDAREAVITKASRSDAEALNIRTGAWILHRYQYWRHRTLHQTVSVTSAIPAHLVGLMRAPKPEEPADLWEKAGEPDDPYAVRAHQGDDEPYDVDDDQESEEGTLVRWTPFERLVERHGPIGFSTTVTARMPFGDEPGDLDVSSGTPVLDVRRTMVDSHGRPLEVTTITAPSDRFEVASAPQWLATARSTGGESATVLTV